jgi:phosphoribosylformimino-5-aminoimidazole carboxamide ribotide isomerase
LKIIPAIDIKEGKCVRLTNGEFENKKVYFDSPVDAAKMFIDQGIDYIHIVDLDGALNRSENNRQVISSIVSLPAIKVQLGGGIRTYEDAKELLDMGVERIILGTVAVENRELTKALIKEYGDRIIVGIDVDKGYVKTRGWKENSGLEGSELLSDLSSYGCKMVVYTDISCDGTLEGPNVELYRELSKSSDMKIVASGGVGSMKDIEDLRKTGVYGVVVGKAIYENRIDIKELGRCLQNG